MERHFKLFALASVVAGLFASCNNGEIVPDTPAEGKLVQLTFGTADAPGTRAVWKDEAGKGNLIFNWDSDPLGQRMVAVISNGDHFIPNYPDPNNLNEYQYHTGLTVTPQEDPHYATFKTERYYYENIISTDAQKIFVTSARGNTFSSSFDMFNSSIDMSSLFVQQASQQPDFLREWMMLYGEAEMKNGSALISF
ncbi:MAG: RHS repeat protein, partial [Bacteroidaceae bacterium]|nr:RHS repeat protein [Bacteroidaceae bacterium]